MSDVSDEQRPVTEGGTSAAETEWVVIRPAGELDDSGLPSVFDGEWRRRSELVDPAGIDIEGPDGPVRAVPSDRRETSPDGNVAQVYEVPDLPGGGSDDDDGGSGEDASPARD